MARRFESYWFRHQVKGNKMNSPNIVTKNGNYMTLDDKNQLHSFDDNPSYIDSRGTMSWHHHGLLDRKKGPAVKSNEYELYYKLGQLHREDDEPSSIEFKSGRRIWYKNNLIHRVLGPAVIASAGNSYHEEYWIFGQKYVSKEVWEATASQLRVVDMQKEVQTVLEEPSDPKPDAVEVVKEKKTRKPRKKKVLDS